MPIHFHYSFPAELQDWNHVQNQRTREAPWQTKRIQAHMCFLHTLSQNKAQKLCYVTSRAWALTSSLPRYSPDSRLNMEPKDFSDRMRTVLREADSLKLPSTFHLRYRVTENIAQRQSGWNSLSMISKVVISLDECSFILTAPTFSAFLYQSFLDWISNQPLTKHLVWAVSAPTSKSFAPCRTLHDYLLDARSLFRGVPASIICPYQSRFLLAQLQPAITTITPITHHA